jgi:spore maturation protein CgeB
MKFVLFYHSLVSDWNHGNAHFLRGVVRELIELGHEVDVYEPASGWSLHNLLQEQGQRALAEFHAAYPDLTSRFYTQDQLDLQRVLDGADIALVHEWNTPELIARVASAARQCGVRAYFHDTHHRSITDPDSMAALDLSDYEGVLAFGQTIADRYRERGWAQQVWVWHEAADTRQFHPCEAPREGDLVWIGNWGDDERSEELHEFLIHPVAALGLRARIYGVRYPAAALDSLQRAGITYGGWLANHHAPAVFARYRCTVHVPRRVYSQQLAGIPTIRMFEALACGIPLVSAPWDDAEQLFRPGTDYLVARSGAEMRDHLRAVLATTELARSLIHHGLETIRNHHTCAHRVRELLHIIGDTAETHPAKGQGDSSRASLPQTAGVSV